MEFGNENVRVRVDDDRISSLPDEIIHRIMSFNDTKYAVQTSVLSSRWKLIWTTLPYLNLSYDAFHILPKFFKFVNRVLSLRNHQTEVSSLDLCFRGSADQKIVQKIASYAVSHNVQKVNIFTPDLKGKEDREFPPCLFSSQSLRHLSIEVHSGWNHIFPLPQSPWDTPALTTVELNNVWLCPDNTSCLDQFSKCVNLMNLTLTDCRTDLLKCMKIRCPRLVCLSISRCWPSTFEILAPNLSTFYYEGCKPLFLSTGGLNSLQKVNLCVGITTSMLSNEKMQRMAHEFMDMLFELRNANVVILHGQVMEFFSKALDFLEHQPSPFCNLKCLRIEGLERPEKQRRGKRAKSDMTDQVITYLLNSSPTATVSKEFRKDPYAKLREVNALNCSEEMRKLKKDQDEEKKKLDKDIDVTRKQIAAQRDYLTSLASYLAELAERSGVPPPPPPPWSKDEEKKKLEKDIDATRKQIAAQRAYLTSLASYLAELAERSGMPPPPPPPWSK